MLSVKEIANYFIALAVSKGGKEGDISPLKLQKLVYYAQGYFLAMYGEPLFSEVIQAWKYGPVVPELYREYRAFEHRSIPPDTKFDRFRFDSEATRLFLEDVYADRGHLSAWHLSEMTHQERPWVTTFDRTRDKPIPNELLQAFFEERLRLGLKDLMDEEDLILHEVLSTQRDLAGTIHHARRELDSRFGPDATMLLRGRLDPEGDHQYAALYVLASMSPEEAAQRLESFQEDWWLDRTTHSRLVINIELE